MPVMDWTEHMDRQIGNKKEMSILEFGIGDGTEYLLDNFKFVFSHELSPDANWYNAITSRFASRENWDHKLVLWHKIGFEDYNPNIPQALKDDIDTLFETHNFDVVFIDGGYHVRGDIADYILHKHMPLRVIIHDITIAYEEDGYGRIQMPDLYSYEAYHTGEGTGIFTKTGYL